MATLTNPLRKWHIVLRCTIFGPLSPLFRACKAQVHYCDHVLSVRPSLIFHIFGFSSEIAERNLTKLEGNKISTSSTKFVFFGPIGKTKWRTDLLLVETFWTSPLKALNGIQRNLTGSKISTFSTTQVCVFRADRKNKMAAAA